MRIIHFDRSQEIPIVDAFIRGANETSKLRLVFDTGAGLTQIDAEIMEELGYTPRDGIDRYHIQGPAGEVVEGYRIKAKMLTVLGKKFENITIGVIDFDNFSHYGIGGLLGFDLIKEFDLELKGKEGVLIIK